MLKKKGNNLSRRRFMKQGGCLAGAWGLLGTTAWGCTAGPSSESMVTAPYINFQKVRRWRLVTTWPPNFPILGEGCVHMARWVKEMSQGALEIKVYGGGELVPALEVFEAVSSGAVQMGHGAAYYWAGKVPATPFFATLPFGMNAQQVHSWIAAGGGQALWEELYAPFGLIPMAAGNTGVQMAGWFNKEIRDISDFRGLKMRIPGLGATVLNKAGGTAVLVAGGEIYTNLERGVIDATEWVGPCHDYLMGFPEVARYYYYPGWHEPGAVLEQILHKESFNALPSALQAILRSAVARLNSWILYEFEARNSLYLEKIKQNTQTQIRKLPLAVLEVLRHLSEETLAELAATNPSVLRVQKAFFAFKKRLQHWNQLGEALFHTHIAQAP